MQQVNNFSIIPPKSLTRLCQRALLDPAITNCTRGSASSPRLLCRDCGLYECVSSQVTAGCDGSVTVCDVKKVDCLLGLSHKQYLQILASALKFIRAGISEQIKDKPVGVEILGEKLVLVRDSNGVVQCLQDVCPHRGAPLHMG